MSTGMVKYEPPNTPSSIKAMGREETVRIISKKVIEG